jgi:hypothetical protein
MMVDISVNHIRHERKHTHLPRSWKEEEAPSLSCSMTSLPQNELEALSPFCLSYIPCRRFAIELAKVEGFSDQSE